MATFTCWSRSGMRQLSRPILPYNHAECTSIACVRTFISEKKSTNFSFTNNIDCDLNGYQQQNGTTLNWEKVWHKYSDRGAVTGDSSMHYRWGGRGAVPWRGWLCCERSLLPIKRACCLCVSVSVCKRVAVCEWWIYQHPVSSIDSPRSNRQRHDQKINIMLFENQFQLKTELLLLQLCITKIVNNR